MEPAWSGPYTVNEVLSKGRYRLANGNDEPKKSYYGTMLKPYFCEDGFEEPKRGRLKKNSDKIEGNHKAKTLKAIESATAVPASSSLQMF